jgi:hypothetical protein
VSSANNYYLKDTPKIIDSDISSHNNGFLKYKNYINSVSSEYNRSLIEKIIYLQVCFRNSMARRSKNISKNTKTKKKPIFL